MSTAVVPAYEPSLIYEAPDTTRVEGVPPIRVDGEMTEPARVTVYSDGSSHPIVDIEAVTVDRIDHDQQTVTVRTQGDSTTFALSIPDRGRADRPLQRHLWSSPGQSLRRPVLL
jgi:hypothetical protein